MISGAIRSHAASSKPTDPSHPRLPPKSSLESDWLLKGNPKSPHHLEPVVHDSVAAGFGAELAIGAIAAAISGILTWLLMRTVDTRANGARGQASVAVGKRDGTGVYEVRFASTEAVR
jgi:hypothetical protein